MTKTLSQFISYLFFLFFSMLIGILPFRLLYIISNFIAWVLRRLFKYRLNVVLENLSKSDLELTPSQTRILVKQIYRNLSDILLEGMKSFSMSQSTVLARHKVLNAELLDPLFEKRQSVILVTGHLGNWEWGSLSAGIQTPLRIVGFYKPLRNKYINNFIRNSRARFGTVLAPIRQTSQSFEKYTDQPSMFLMAADQSPTKIAQSYWINFLGRETAFLHGPEKHAIKNNYPIIFADIKRVKRGVYELELSLLVEKPALCKPGEITEIYARKMESIIRKDPANWLWTHRRWKKKKQPVVVES